MISFKISVLKNLLYISRRARLCSFRSIYIVGSSLVYFFLALLSCTPGASATQSPAAENHNPPATNLNTKTDSILESAVAAFSEERKEKIQKNRLRFEELLIEVFKQPDDLVVLVDKKHSLPGDYEPIDLENLDDHSPPLFPNRREMYLRAVVLPSLKRMSAEALSQGIKLDISSSYRSYRYQTDLFERNVVELGIDEAQRQSARAGTSQHQLGTVMDFGSITPAFANTPAGKWLRKHAWEFGFSLSYPENYEDKTGYIFEPWHYRYIGEAASKLEREFFNGLQQDLLEFLFVYGADLKEALRIANE